MFSARLSLFAVLLFGCSLFAEQPNSPKPRSSPASEQIARWIVQLGDDSYFVREAASEKLGEAGDKAEPALKAALASPDAEVVRRAGELLEQIHDAREVVSAPPISVPDAIKKAKDEKKVVMVNFWADWCGPCKQFDTKTFSEEKVQTFLKDKTVAIKVNIDENKLLTDQYKITAIPCLVFLDGEGKEVGRVLGFRTTEYFLEEATKIVTASVPVPVQVPLPAPR